MYRNTIKKLSKHFRDAGSSKAGDPYGNLCIQYVASPQVIANYFKYFNRVDVHNQVRQFDIGLEKKRVTPNPYQIYTSHTGMDLADLWKSFKRHQKDLWRIFSTTEFTDITTYDLI